MMLYDVAYQPSVGLLLKGTSSSITAVAREIDLLTIL